MSPFYGNPGDAELDMRWADSGLRQRDGGPRLPGNEAGTDAAGTDPLPPDASACATPPCRPPSDPERDKLIGHYAILARYYGNERSSALGWFIEEQILLGEIADEQGTLTLRYSFCALGNTIHPPFLTPVRGDLAKPEKLPSRKHVVSISDGAFSTLGAPMLVGYEDVSPTACPANKRVAQPDRAWLADGTCACPGTEGLPTSSDDCRVIDSDADGKPGATARYSTGTDAYVRGLDSSEFVQGVIRDDKRHTAGYRRIADVYQLECDKGTCTYADLVVCTAEKNAARFVPLESPPASGNASWTCQDVLREINRGMFGLDNPVEPRCGS